jgi:MFS family permease
VDVAEQVMAATREKRALLLAFGVFGVFWGAWSSLLPAIKAQAHLSDGQLGLALAAIAVAALPAMPVAGRLVDRLGAGRLVRMGLVAFGLVSVLPAVAGSELVLVLVFVLVGLTTGFLDVVINTATAAWERVEAARLMSAVHGVFSAGTLVGSVGTGFARSAGAGPAQVLPVVAVIVVAAGVLQPSYRRPPREESPPPRSRLGVVLLCIGALVAASFLVEDALQSWSALQLERGLGAPPWVSGLGPGLFAAAMTAGRFGSHLLGEGHRETTVVRVGGFAVAAGAVVLAVAPTPFVALIGVALAGAGTSVLAPTLFSAVGSRSQEGRQGAALGAVSTLGYIGFLVGPPIVGLVSAATSLPVALGSLGLVGVAVALAGPLVLRLPVSTPPA